MFIILLTWFGIPLIILSMGYIIDYYKGYEIVITTEDIIINIIIIIGGYLTICLAIIWGIVWLIDKLPKIPFNIKNKTLLTFNKKIK